MLWSCCGSVVVMLWWCWSGGVHGSPGCLAGSTSTTGGGAGRGQAG